MTVKMKKLNLLAALTIASLTTMAAKATEYHPADLKVDPDNAYSRGGRISSRDGIVTLKSLPNSTMELWNEKIGFKNGTISVDVRFSPDASMSESRAGLMFFKTAVHTYWSFQLNPSGKFCVLKYVNNQSDFLKHTTSTLHANQGANVWNTLSIKTTDTKVTAFVNGHEVFTCPHKSGSDERVGIQYQDPGTADFRNFKVTY